MLTRIIPAQTCAKAAWLGRVFVATPGFVGRFLVLESHNGSSTPLTSRGFITVLQDTLCYAMGTAVSGTPLATFGVRCPFLCSHPFKPIRFTASLAACGGGNVRWVSVIKRVCR